MRAVVKIGSRLLTGKDGLDVGRLEAFAAQIAAARSSEIVVVSSGAIACGWPRLGLKARPTTLPELQAAAAAGQARLIRAWEDALAAHGIVVAQVLMTHADAANRRRFLNVRDALLSLLSLGALPVVNENDSVATEEIRYGDNDNLSADVATLLGADLLVLLTDIEGLFDADPRANPRAKLIPEVTDIDRQALPVARGPGSSAGTGGMITKVQAARKATASGIPVVITDGRDAGNLGRVLAGEAVGTRFRAADRVAARKHWIAWTLKSEGTVTIDDGARKALKQGTRSLLPRGVRLVEGSFRRGAAVTILDENKRELGRGLCAYDADDARRIAGSRSSEIAGILGYTFGDELIHKDDLVLRDGG